MTPKKAKELNTAGQHGNASKALELNTGDGQQGPRKGPATVEQIDQLHHPKPKPANPPTRGA
jgi:hypothetical protein